MVGVRLLLGLCVTLVGCASDDKGDTGSDDMGLKSCGISDGKVFEVQVNRVTLAPATDEGMRWDSDELDAKWDEDLQEWRDLSKTVSTSGTFQRGTYDDVVAVTEYFEATLFASTAAPDPAAVLYSSDNGGKRWDVAQEWGQIAGNTFEVDGLYLGRWTLGGDKRINIQFLDADAPDTTRVGDLVITGVLAQSVANCGPMGLVLSEAEMRAQDSRVHAIEIEVKTID